MFELSNFDVTLLIANRSSPGQAYWTRSSPPRVANLTCIPYLAYLALCRQSDAGFSFFRHIPSLFVDRIGRDQVQSDRIN